MCNYCLIGCEFYVSNARQTATFLTMQWDLIQLPIKD